MGCSAWVMILTPRRIHFAFRQNRELPQPVALTNQKIPFDGIETAHVTDDNSPKSRKPALPDDTRGSGWCLRIQLGCEPADSSFAHMIWHANCRLMHMERLFSCDGFCGRVGGYFTADDTTLLSKVEQTVWMPVSERPTQKMVKIATRSTLEWTTLSV